MRRIGLLWMRRLTSLCCAAFVLGSIVGLAPVASAQTDLPSPTRSGGLSVVTATAPVTERSSGGSNDEFVVVLPNGATCPGDGMNDDYRIQSFLVPAEVDPSTIVYSSIGPRGDDQTALVMTNSSFFTDQFSEPNQAPGQPGVVPALPAMTFGAYDPTQLDPGSYRMGIACTYFGTTTNWWDVELRLDHDPADQPAQLHWTITGETTSVSSGGSDLTRNLMLFGCGAVAVLALIGLLALRRPRAARTTT